MIEALHLTKRYGGRVAGDDLSFEVHFGHVTGFLGPNGAGKSTTMRLLLGLRPARPGDGAHQRQRLGFATALLGDQGVLVLDEPVNGLGAE